jgi:hypothetical protein
MRPVPRWGSASWWWPESRSAAVEVVGQDHHQRSFDGNAPILLALTAYLDDGAVGGGADVADIGAHKLIGA